jgi:hypothetical protein
MKSARAATVVLVLLVDSKMPQRNFGLKSAESEKVLLSSWIVVKLRCDKMGSVLRVQKEPGSQSAQVRFGRGEFVRLQC